MTERTAVTGLLTIGQLARASGLSVRTIRFWSDHGLLPPARRSPGGYRLYDETAVARLDLVHTLRELGLGVDTVRRVLQRRLSVADVAGVQARALDAQIGTLMLRRALLRAIAERGHATAEELRLMHRLARLTAAQRQEMIDEFVDRTFAGLDPAAPGAGLAAAMRQLPPELPAQPTDAQVRAWVELAELISDPDFRDRVRQMAVAGTTAAPAAVDAGPVLTHAGRALAEGVAPDSAAGQAVLARVVPGELDAAGRTALADRLATFTDRRVERYWQLLGVLNGREPFPPAAPAFEWLIAALRAA